MPAPTALIRAPERLAKEEASPRPESASQPSQRDILSDLPTSSALSDPRSLSMLQQQSRLENDAMQIDIESRPLFSPEQPTKTVHRSETRKVRVPPNRMSPLKSAWLRIYPPLVEHLKLQVRMNLKAKMVELRTSKHTFDSGALQKGHDFITAFTLGFDVEDAIALLRLDDLYIETFEIRDVKTLQGEHLGRGIGRIVGKDGKTKFAIENATKTRVSVTGQTVHILGGFKNIHMAREAVVSLILGSEPRKVYGNLRTVATRMKERF